jgi:predicted Ser/Thr protein kinase
VTSTRIGTEIAGYRIERLLGRGGMSVVYLAEHMRLGRKVALKLLAPALSEDDSFRERFIRESRRAAELDHPNVIPIYDAGEDDGQLYIAMRYVEGCDLKELIRRTGPLPLGRALFLIEQVAGALDAAHERNLIHRDVKPSNILVAERSDLVFLTDFGVVKHTASRGLTTTGLFIGTVDYAAPEQIEGLSLGPETDIYALGCVLYESLAGEPPYEREGEIAVMHAHLSEPPPVLTAVRPDLPKSLNRVIATAMAKARDDRYPSCDELVFAARAAALQRQTQPVPVADAEVEPEPEPEPEPEAALTPPPEPQPQPVAATAATEAPAARRGQPSPWLAAAGAAILAAVISGVVVYFATRSDNGQPAAATTGSTTTTNSPAPERGIAPIIPTVLFKNSCTLQPTPVVAGAVQSAVCTPPANASDRKMSFYPDRWEASIFPNAAALHRAYAALRAQNDVGQNFGTCNGVAWGGEGVWLHNPVAGARAKLAGRRFCYFEGNVAVIVWTHEKFGQATHIDLLGVAREGGSDHPTLFGWWRFWHHRIGKCQTEGCTAQL